MCMLHIYCAEQVGGGCDPVSGCNYTATGFKPRYGAQTYGSRFTLILAY